MILFVYYYLSACLTLGITPLPTSVMEHGIPVWGRLCNSCEVRQVQFSQELIDYNNVHFTRAVAEHEACHQFLGHTAEWVAEHYFTANAETEARRCTEERFWTSWDTEERLAAEANAWLAAREVR